MPAVDKTPPPPQQQHPNLHNTPISPHLRRYKSQIPIPNKNRSFLLTPRPPSPHTGKCTAAPPLPALAGSHCPPSPPTALPRLFQPSSPRVSSVIWYRTSPAMIACPSTLASTDPPFPPPPNLPLALRSRRRSASRRSLTPLRSANKSAARGARVRARARGAKRRLRKLRSSLGIRQLNAPHIKNTQNSNSLRFAPPLPPSLSPRRRLRLHHQPRLPRHASRVRGRHSRQAQDPHEDAQEPFQ